MTMMQSSPVNSSCCILSFFHSMYYCPVLCCIVCPFHNTLVAFDDLESHITLDHAVACKIISYDVPHLLKHFSHHFSILINQSQEIVLANISHSPPRSLIPGLTLPMKCI